MRAVADLHIHSRFSIATSPKLTPPALDRWAGVKGIDILGTGDCTHPAWLAELRSSLEPAEEGFFRLKDGLRREYASGQARAEGLPESSRDVRFVLTGEISTIYSRDGRTRKVHHVVLLPGFEAAAAFQARLERIGNISSDGRPILGLDSRDLFRLLLDSDERAVLVPAHIWTPWFSALGARSGFDSIEECYGDLAGRIGAVETGLSSNPPMNWAVSGLDRFAIVSNSDAHSPDKLGREATILDLEPSWEGLRQALSGGGGRGRVLETVEFFPQEGKYHWDGHRACGVARPPGEIPDGLCPVCGKPLTPGVLRRVTELADRPVEERAPCPPDASGTNRRPYRSLVPLRELLAEIVGAGPGSGKAASAYNALVEAAGSEFGLLLDLDPGDIRGLRAPGVPGGLLAEAVGRVRAGNVYITPGYDGRYGAIRAFAPGEGLETRLQEGLFGEAPRKPRKERPAASKRIGKSEPIPAAFGPPHTVPREAFPGDALPFAPDPAQEAAVDHPGNAVLVIAGPGSGKTSVLARRIARILGEGADPASFLALTFTNKAAGELRDRIAGVLEAAGSRSSDAARAVTASTFHAFCLSVLRLRAADAGLSPAFTVLGEDERAAFLEAAARGKDAAASGRPGAKRLAGYIESRKRFLLLPGERSPRLGPGAPQDLAEAAADLGIPGLDPGPDVGYAAYRSALKAADALDFDDLVSGTVRLFSARPDILAEFRDRFRRVFVDEYQDVNFAQYALVRLLAPALPQSGEPTGADGHGRSLFAIGDPNQAVYAFRGSDPRLLDLFTRDHPGASVLTLARSFRCAPALLEAAGRLADTRLEGAPRTAVLRRAEAPTGKAEAEGIAREIDRMIGGTRFFALDSGTAGDGTPAAESPTEDPGGCGTVALRGLGECAVLVRAAALIPPVAKALRDHGLPYRVVGEVPWWEEEPSRSILSLLRAALRDLPAGAPAPDAAESALRGRLPGLGPAESVQEAIRALRETGKYGKPPGDDARERLLGFAAGFRDRTSFLDALTLGSPGDCEGTGERNSVSLMTIHAAKGLEFDHVFLPALEEGILPFTLFDLDGESPVDRIAEERRLLYVAITRARAGLHLWRAKKRDFLGRRLSLPPSRFLAEIEDLISRKEEAPRRERNPQLGLF